MPKKLELCLGPLAADECDFVCHNITAEGPEGSEVLDCAKHLAPGTDPLPALLLRGFIATSSVVTKRDLVIAAGGFDPGLPAAQDYDLWVALAKPKGIRFRALPQNLSVYHVNPSGITSNVNRRLECGLRTFRRHAGALEGRTESPWKLKLKRIAIMHMEAFVTHIKRFQIFAAMGVAMGFCFSVPNYFLDPDPGEDVRRNFLE